MANNRKMQKDFPTDKDKIVLSVTVRYTKGDPFSNEKRGYWVTIMPEEIDGMWRKSVAYSGVKFFVEEANRFSAKRLGEIFDRVINDIEHNTESHPRSVFEKVVESADCKVSV